MAGGVGGRRGGGAGESGDRLFMFGSAAARTALQRRPDHWAPWRATRPLGRPDGSRARHLRPAPREPDAAGMGGSSGWRPRCPGAAANVAPVARTPSTVPTVRSPGGRLPRPTASKKSGSAVRIATSAAVREPAGPWAFITLDRMLDGAVKAGAIVGSGDRHDVPSPSELDALAESARTRAGGLGRYRLARNGTGVAAPPTTVVHTRWPIPATRN